MNERKKMSRSVIILITIIILIAFGILINTLVNNSSSRIQIPDEIIEVSPIFSNYIDEGTDFTIDQDNPDFKKTRNGEQLKYIVGKDIEPGTYTLYTDTGNPEIHLELGIIQSDFVNSKVGITESDSYFNLTLTPNTFDPFYNLLLSPGDVVEFKNIPDAEFSHRFVAQTDYVTYDHGLSGVFAYEVSTRDEQVNFAENDLYRAWFFTNENGYVFEESDGNEYQFEHSRGSYMIIDYRKSF